ncbi:MAG: hypothetical protein MZW92_57730 [Comamonadaceae bacterium]|nr:hypothetical protein [Comamonadaceae bacterium]
MLDGRGPAADAALAHRQHRGQAAVAGGRGASATSCSSRGEAHLAAMFNRTDSEPSPAVVDAASPRFARRPCARRPRRIGLGRRRPQDGRGLFAADRRRGRAGGEERGAGAAASASSSACWRR